jgi:hypothetical protein
MRPTHLQTGQGSDGGLRPMTPNVGAVGQGSPLWVQLDTLHLGDILSIRTENKQYEFAMVGRRAALLTSSNPDVPSGIVVLHGSYPLDEVSGLNADIVWGSISVGSGALFANHAAPTQGVRTSKVLSLNVIKAGTYNSAYSSSSPINSLGRVVRATSPAAIASPTPNPTLGLKALTGVSIGSKVPLKPSVGVVAKPIPKPFGLGSGPGSGSGSSGAKLAPAFVAPKSAGQGVVSQETLRVVKPPMPKAMVGPVAPQQFGNLPNPKVAKPVLKPSDFMRVKKP